MSKNDLVRVEFSKNEKQFDQIVYKELNAQAANIIGTSYKGPAFVPQLIVNEDNIDIENIKNVVTKKLGSHRQNFCAHLFDEYSCYANSDAYDSISTWFAGGGDYAYFTRVLGVGTLEKNNTTGKC